MSKDYQAFLASKAQYGKDAGFEAKFVPKKMFGFQEHLTLWAIRKGRGAIYADCGLGKSVCELTWAENIVRKTNKPVLLLTPLGVTSQMVKEAEKFGIDCVRSRDGKFSGKRTIVTNYEQLDKFSPDDFGGCVCDEAAIIKNSAGMTRHAVTEFMRTLPFRLLATATPAPNDYIELGTSSEALGELGNMDMLQRFFKNENNTLHPMRDVANGGRFKEGRNAWRFKPHAEMDFWRWVCSWSRSMKKPSDLGFDDGPFVLPELIVRQKTVNASRPMDGWLFKMPAVGLKEQRLERKSTHHERCEAVAELVDHKNPAIVWCDMNAEGLGIELKTTYFNQAVKNMTCVEEYLVEDGDMFAGIKDDSVEDGDMG